MMKEVIKREKAMKAAGCATLQGAAAVTEAVVKDLETKYPDTPPKIEEIQDVVERELMRLGFDDAAKQYILYRANRTRIREANTSLMKTIDEITKVDARQSDVKRDNANIDGNTAMGSMLQIGTAGAKAYNEAYLLTPEQAKAYREGDIHMVSCASRRAFRATRRWRPSPSSPTRTTSTAARASRTLITAWRWASPRPSAKPTPTS